MVVDNDADDDDGASAGRERKRETSEGRDADSHRNPKSVTAAATDRPTERKSRAPLSPSSPSPSRGTDDGRKDGQTEKDEGRRGGFGGRGR